jgi:Uma2 family endonuclease
VVRQPPAEELGDDDWERMPMPLLVVEVSSPSTRRRDLGVKRDFYMEVGVPEYWFFDRESRRLHVVRSGAADLLVSDAYQWQPGGASEPLVVEIQRLVG